MTAKASETRNNLIKVIHVAKRELEMDDGTYREMLSNIPELDGVTSIAKLSIPKLRVVFDTLKKRGFKVRPKAKSKGKPHNFDDAMPESITKIEALLADMGLPWSYADSIAFHMFGIQRCAWVRTIKQLSAIIAALHVEQEKRSKEQTINELLSSLTKSRRDEIVAMFPARWNRQRRVMNHIIEAISAELEGNHGS